MGDRKKDKNLENKKSGTYIGGSEWNNNNNNNNMKSNDQLRPST